MVCGLRDGFMLYISERCDFKLLLKGTGPHWQGGRGRSKYSNGAHWQLTSSTLGVPLGKSGKDYMCQLSLSCPGQRKSIRDDA